MSSWRLGPGRSFQANPCSHAGEQKRALAIVPGLSHWTLSQCWFVASRLGIMERFSLECYETTQNVVSGLRSCGISPKQPK